MNVELTKNDPKRVDHQKPMLTLAIPTYNRASCLRDLLSALFDQVKDQPRIELLVSDNASPDETPLVVKDFVARGLGVRYLRNVENIGPDANFLQCFEQAQGKYVWLFSDDDIIIPGGLARILAYCERAEYDVIWVSGYTFADKYRARTAEVRDGAIEISDPSAYVKLLHVFFTFISGNIINKDRVLAAGPMPFSSLIGTNLAQLGWTYTAVNGFVRGLYIRDKLIAVRQDNSGGYKFFQVFGPTLATVTQNWVRSAELSRIVMNGTIQRFWPAMLLKYKKGPNGSDSGEKPQDILTPAFRGNIRYWIFAYPVIVLPSLLAAVWVFACRILNRIDKNMEFLMLSGRDRTGNS